VDGGGGEGGGGRRGTTNTISDKRGLNPENRRSE